MPKGGLPPQPRVSVDGTTTDSTVLHSAVLKSHSSHHGCLPSQPAACPNNTKPRAGGGAPHLPLLSVLIQQGLLGLGGVEGLEVAPPAAAHTRLSKVQRVGCGCTLLCCGVVVSRRCRVMRLCVCTYVPVVCAPVCAQYVHVCADWVRGAVLIQALQSQAGRHRRQVGSDAGICSGASALSPISPSHVGGEGSPQGWGCPPAPPGAPGPHAPAPPPGSPCSPVLSVKGGGGGAVEGVCVAKVVRLRATKALHQK